MNFLVTMSGGTTQVINSTLAGVIDGIRKFYPSAEIFIPKPGIIGLLEDNIYRVKWHGVDTKSLSKLPGSSITGTTRIKILDDDEIESLEAKLTELRIGTFINIGGSGTIKQSLQLSSKFKDIDFIALPKTIDNDLGDKEFKQLSYTPGYLSAIRYIISHTFNLIRENEGACSSDKVLVSQVFGRDTGHIGAISTLVGNDRVLTLFPERPVSWANVKAAIEAKIKKHGGCVVVVPEGYQFDEHPEDGEDFQKEYDLSGQVMWGSSYSSIAQIISNRLNDDGIQSRISNTTIEQRQCFSLMDSNDIKRSYGVGYTAISHRVRGRRNFFNSIQMKEDGTYKTVAIDLADIKDFNRKLPTDWISKDGFGVTKEFFAYIKSLNLGDVVTGKYYMDPLTIIEKYEVPK